MNVFRENFRFTLTAQNFTGMDTELTLSDFTYTLYDTADESSPDYNVEGHYCLKAEVRGMEKLIVQSKEIPMTSDCTLAPVG